MRLDELLRTMVERRASDLFVTAGDAPALKVHGRLLRLPYEPLDEGTARALAYGVMGERQRAEFEATHEANFAVERPGLGRFRANVFRHQGRIGMVLRRIETRIPTVAELRLPPLLETLSLEARGLVLVVGATGTGKSTTLAAMVGHRNRHGEGHIVCIEDPIEFLHRPQGCMITQREVGIDTESFEAALRNALRQAPDVILVGEIRTREAMEHAIAFAETGHLCLATLHATNAAQALDRAVHFFPRDQRDRVFLDLALNLKAVVAQRLVPTADGRGRRAALEILLNTPLAADLIQRGETHLLKDLMKRSEEQGMQTFGQAVYRLYCEGLVTEEEALRHADSANEVRLMIKLGRGPGERLGEALMRRVGLLPTEEGPDGEGPGEGRLPRRPPR